MGDDGQSRGGPIESLRRIGDTGLALLQNRLALFAVELQEEKERLIRVVALVAVLVFLVNMGIVMLTVTIVILAGEDYRNKVLIGLCALYLLSAVAVFLVLRKHLRTAPAPFSETVSELKKDRDWLKPPK
jgi:uncharacterized membrane protein YqjE